MDVDRSGFVDMEEFKEVAIVLSEREERRHAEQLAVVGLTHSLKGAWFQPLNL